MLFDPQAPSAGAAVPVPEKAGSEPAAAIQQLARELRKPVGVIEQIAFYLDMALPRADAKARRRLSQLQRELRAMKATLSDALFYYAPPAPRLVPVDVGEAITDALTPRQPLDNAWLCLNIAEDLPQARLDPAQFDHLLRNIIGHLARIASRQRAMLLTAASHCDTILLEFSACVPDVDPSELTAPFDSDAPAAAGFAVASAHKIAEAHGATLSASFDPPDRFLVRLVIPAA